MDLRQIWILYRHELRSALRDRSIVVMSILIPLVMYPLLLWGAFAAISFVQGQTERQVARVAVHDVPEAHRSLVDSLAARDGVLLVEWMEGPEEATAALSRGGLDAFVRFESPPVEVAGLEENVRISVSFNEARDRSRRARAEVASAVAQYRQAWIEEARSDLGIEDGQWAGFTTVREDLATPEDATRVFLALIIPMLTLIMVALASFYPAIDATAGERERSTWETLMTVASPRGNVAAAKYLYVATFGAMGGLLNVVALTLTLRWVLAPIAGPGEVAAAAIPLSTLPVIAVGTMLLGLFVAAGMLVFAIFARNFKEGQSAITPFYTAIILPAVFLQSPDLELTNRLALVPVANVVLLIRGAIEGSVPLVAGGLTLLSMAVTVGAAVAFAQWVMRREEVLLGSSGAGLIVFLKGRFQARRSER